MATKLTVGINDLAAVNPELAQEWDYSHNDGMTPQSVTLGSSKKVWWIGKCGHEWKASISNRVKGRGCPYCSGKRVLKGFNDLATVNPNLSQEWDYEKNPELTPELIYAHSSKKVWWICPKGHSYSMKVAHRMEGHSCPFCAGERPIAGENDLATTHPDIAKEWHPTKNGNLKPTAVMKYTNKKVWWLGKCGHEWEALIVSRTVGKMGCPICNPVGTSFPEQALLFYILKVFPDAKHRYKKARIEFDIYLEKMNIAIEYDGVYYHQGKKKLIKDNSKDEFCFRNGIQLIRIREEGLPTTDYAINIVREKPYLEQTLEDVIIKLLSIISPDVKINIDLERDYGFIKLSYFQLGRELSLAMKYPEVASEWDNNKNYPLTAYDVLPNSNKKVWWICSKGHSYQSNITNRTRVRSGCPYCSGNKVIVGETDLFTKHHELASEWDIDKNRLIDPKMVASGSGIKVWWKCRKCGYSWKAAVCDRTGKEKTGCPACAGKKIWKGHNDLETKFPEVAKQWNYKRNEAKPFDYIPGSEKEVWWICPKGHEYKRKVFLQVASQVCPICSKREIVEGVNDLWTMHPDLMHEWDYGKNKDIDPQKVGDNSGKAVWWICPKGHSYKKSIRSRTKEDKGCPYCSGRKIAKGETDLQSSYPYLAEEWDYEANKLKPNEVSKGHHEPVFWICNKGHRWKESISNRIRRNTKCPYCYPRRTLLPGVNDLSITEPTIASEWDYKKNLEMKTTDVMRGSSKKAWWICPRGHSYYSSINMRTSQGLGCPYCSGQKVLRGYNDLATTHPQLLKEWDYEKNTDITPTEISKGCNKKVFWICVKGHKYEASVNSRAITGNGCPYCSGHKVLKGFNDIKTTHPDISEEWDFERNGNLIPEMVSAGSNKVVWWKCLHCGHEWKMKIHMRCHGGKCPKCKRKV